MDRYSVDTLKNRSAFEFPRKPAENVLMHNRGYRLVLRPTSLGINAPHCITFHTDCNSRNQNTVSRSNVTRVKSGSLKMYDRSLAGLNCGNVGAIKAMSVALGNCS